MTAYNAKYRCDGGQKRPLKMRGAWLGLCSNCNEWFKIYPTNGMVVMHKKISQAVLRLNKEMKNV